MALTRVRTAPSSALLSDLATVRVLVQRDVSRFFREKSRVIGALAQPLLFWLIIGSGMSPTFHLAGSDVGYLGYFFPGVLVMVVLFTSIFATMSVIEDRHAGFLQAVLVGPGSRASVAIGKSLGATTIALVQAGLFALLAGTAGFDYLSIDWPLLFAALTLVSIALTSLGFSIAWWLDSTQGYHVVMSLLLLPLWILSGAMFPTPASGIFGKLALLNPMSYAVSAARRALHGGIAPSGSVATSSAAVELGVLCVFALVGVCAAVLLCEKKR